MTKQSAIYKRRDWLRSVRGAQSQFGKTQELNKLALCLYELARLYERIRQVELALVYFKDALRIYHHLQDEETAAAIHAQLGSLDIQNGLLHSAEENLKAAERYYQASDWLRSVRGVRSLHPRMFELESNSSRVTGRNRHQDLAKVRKSLKLLQETISGRN